MNDLLILIGGIFIGIIGATIGGTMFISVPFWQLLFPNFNYGQIVGNIKVGSLARGIASTWSTRKNIRFKETLLPSIFLSIGTIISSFFIANLDQKYLLIAVIISIIVSELSPKIAHLIKPKTRLLFSLLLGIYMGIFGAGISLLLVALMRTIYKSQEEIALAKIQARFIETVGTIAAVAILIFQNSIVAPYWIYWAIGSFIGGYIGGHILNKTTHLSAKFQHGFLILVYIIALLPFIIKFLT